MHIVGIAVAYDKVQSTGYHFLADVQYLNEFMTICAFCLAASQILFYGNFFYSMFFGEKVTEQNPWKANTLEWVAAPMHPVHGNFGPELPLVYHGPYEFSSPLVEEDYLPQTRKLEMT